MNVIHSIDAYVLRCIHRRCNYDKSVVLQAYEAILSEQGLRLDGYTSQCDGATGKLQYYIEQYERSAMADVVILGCIKDGYQTQYLSNGHLEALAAIVEEMLTYEPFEVVTIH
jgi:hypothetical protein